MFHRLAVIACAVILVLTMAIIPVTAADKPPAPVRVMALGDSITHGGTVPGGYRAVLKAMAVAEGLDFDYVGRLTTNPGPLTDREHEGNPGATSGDLILPGRLAAWASTFQPQVVLVHIGTNDVLKNANLTTSAANVGTIIDLIQSNAPGATVILAQIIPTKSPNMNAKIETFNEMLPAVVANRANVALVNMYSMLTIPDDMTDTAHPNANGQAKIGAAFLSALAPLLSSAPPMATATPTPTTTPTITATGTPRPSTAAPTLTAPPDWSSLTTLRPIFRWTAVSGASDYRLQVASASTFAAQSLVYEATTPDVTLTPPADLSRGGQLSWRVQALDGGSGGPWSAVRHVKLPPYPAPTALAPAPGSIPAAPVAFAWAPVTGATGYRARVSPSATFSGGVMTVTTSGTSTGLAAWQRLQPGVRYYWHLQARGPAGDGLWSSPIDFVAP